MSDVAFRVTCDDGVEYLRIADSYTKGEAIDAFCSPGSGTTVDTPGFYGITCLDTFDLEYFNRSNLEEEAAAELLCG